MALLIALTLLVLVTSIAVTGAIASRVWDGLWYHEPLTGLTIQNHAFAPEPLPGGLQVINGVRRNALLAILALTLAAGLLRRTKRNGGLATAGLVALGSFCVLGMQAITYVRNLILFENPVWELIGPLEAESQGNVWRHRR
ncbi:MAG: hypothetical protein JWM74_4440 [Myxococcaceae bacterium]|nr:hypothetical protein [Myxococcaceae bacterium]